MGTITTVIICAIILGFIFGFMAYCYSTADGESEGY